MGRAKTRYQQYYAHECADVSLDLGTGLAATYDGAMSLRQLLLAFVKGAGAPITFERGRTVQGAPIFIVRPSFHRRVAIGIGETWLDAVAQAYDMWISGT